MSDRKSPISAARRQKIVDACEELKSLGFEIVHHMSGEEYGSFEYFDVNPNEDTIATNIEEIRRFAKSEGFDPNDIDKIREYMGMAFYTTISDELAHVDIGYSGGDSIMNTPIWDMVKKYFTDDEWEL